MIHFIKKAKQTEKDLRTRFADDKFAEWEAQVIDALDVDFSLVRREVHTMKEFEQQLKAPFLENKEKIFYRGERGRSCPTADPHYFSQPAGPV